MDMQKSLYSRYVEKYFEGIVLETVNNINGSQNPENVRYYHREMLRPEFSPNGFWQSVNVWNTRVSADYVAMDSPLPLKKRDRITKTIGEIVKSGMELSLNERQITDINAMLRTPNIPEGQIVASLFQDTPRVIYGIYELMERTFLQALSTGTTLIEDKDNVGIGIRMDFGYLDRNKFEAKTDWTDYDNAKPLDDLKKMKKAAEDYGRAINIIMMDDVTLDHLTNCKQVKDYIGWRANYIGKADIPAPSLDQLNNALRGDNKYGFTIEEIKRKIIVESDAEQTTITPWKQGMVIGLPTRSVGVLAYAMLAEDENPVNGVQYQRAGESILVSKYSSNRPFQEWTSSQARVVPVISGVESIYQLNALPESNSEDEPIVIEP